MSLDEKTLKEFRDTPDGALLGRDFVEKYKDKYPWKIGQSYQLRELGGVSITFVGSYESDNEVYNTIILTGRRFIEEVDDRLGVAHQVYVKIDDPESAGTVIAQLDKEIPENFPFAITTKDQRAFMSAAVADLRETVDFSRWILLITLGVILVSVANTVSMATRDRVQEFGVIRSLGFRRIQVLGLVLTESVILSLVGGALGVLAAAALLNAQDYYYGVLGLNLLIQVTAPVAVSALIVSLGVGVLGGLLPAIGASRLEIVNSLRNVD